MIILMVKWIQGCFISSKMVYELKRGPFARELSSNYCVSCKQMSNKLYLGCKMWLNDVQFLCLKGKATTIIDNGDILLTSTPSFIDKDTIRKLTKYCVKTYNTKKNHLKCVFQFQFKSMMIPIAFGHETIPRYTA